MKILLGITLLAGIVTVLDGAVTFTSPSGSTNIYLAEGSAVGTTILTVAATGETSPYTYTTGEAKTAISSAGILTISDATLLNYESGATKTVVVTAVDSTTGDLKTGSTTVTINIIDLPSFTPGMPLLCVADGAPAGTVIGSVSADGTGTYTYARKSSGNDANATDITVSSAGVFTVSTGVTLDAGKDLDYSIVVEVTDANSEVGTYTVMVYVGCTLATGIGNAVVPAGLAVTLMVAILAYL